MQRLYFVLSILVLSSFLSGCAGNAAAQSNEATPTAIPEEVTPTAILEDVPREPPVDCPITMPQDPPFTAPAPYSPNAPFENNFWYGSNSLWTLLPQEGTWLELPHNPKGYTQKIFWWREGYIWNEEPEPNLTVMGERLDATAPSLLVSRATNAFASDIGSAMLVGVDFPTLGCWKITAQYGDTELSFVIWVGP